MTITVVMWQYKILNSTSSSKKFGHKDNVIPVLDLSQTGVLIDQAAAWFSSGSCLINQAAAWFYHVGYLIDQAAAWFWSGRGLIDQAAAWFW